MAALVATASIETSAPLSPSSSARRSIRAGRAVVSLALSGTASWPSTRRAVVAKAETRCSGGVPVARSWLRREVLPSMAADSAGAVVFRKKLRRGQLLAFLATLPPCTVALEACASAHYWGREIAKLGHTVKLIAPAHLTTHQISWRAGPAV